MSSMTISLCASLKSTQPHNHDPLPIATIPAEFWYNHALLSSHTRKTHASGI